MTKPNILYLHSHDTGRYIQPYGHAVETPNLQKLAKEGILFRRALSHCADETRAWDNYFSGIPLLAPKMLPKIINPTVRPEIQQPHTTLWG